MRELHKHWGSIFTRGILSLLLGFFLIFWPAVGLQLLVLIFGIYCLVDGIIAFFVGNSLKSTVLKIEGLVGILVGIGVWVFTNQAVAAFIIAVGIWAILSGLAEIIAAIELRKYIKNEIWLLLVGITSLLFGLFVFLNPLAAGYALTIVIGLYSLMFGILLMTVAVKVKDYSPKAVKKSSKKKR